MERCSELPKGWDHRWVSTAGKGKDLKSGKSVKTNQITAGVLKVLNTFLKIPNLWPKHLGNNKVFSPTDTPKASKSNFNTATGKLFHTVSLQWSSTHNTEMNSPPAIRKEENY